ncbi:rhomboid family intramembrane serine protease [Lacticaseibacillus zhaodongensis]|uniref:rhomboid family intramembrane serine protease n=1 Tax=Lacticaseibacillus zhaodongensis TaxID=2668065 RepID=UPI0012D2F395|nr:rhomboid family intramembrane serine protease [Lacticaseibacillus zhaodongensis]
MRDRDWSERPFVTYLLIAACVLMFLLEAVAGGSTSTAVLVRLGARVTPYVFAGEWWRLITATFLHIGIMHIAMNMLTLWFLGPLTEQLFGHTRFAVIYLLSGIIGNYAGLFFNSPNVVGAGASTALFGMLGAFLMIGDNFRDNPAVAAMTKQFLILIGINLLFDITQSNIDIAGHIGGLIGGFLVAGVCGAPRFGRISTWKRVLMGVILVVSLLLLYFVYGGSLW